MAYPSILSQPGSAARNVQPIQEALGELISSSRPNDRSSGPTPRIFEIGSFPYEHITAFAEAFEDVEWQGSARDEYELSQIESRLAKGELRLRANLEPPISLDIGHEEDWQSLLKRKEGKPPFIGILMINIIHCCPEGLPEEIFKHFSPLRADGSALLDPRSGWIAAYGPFLGDNGAHRSEGDAKFDESHVKSTHQSLGLRTIPSVTAMAERWGFVEERRLDMPKGNSWIVWRVCDASG